MSNDHVHPHFQWINSLMPPKEIPHDHMLILRLLDAVGRFLEQDTPETRHRLLREFNAIPIPPTLSFGAAREKELLEALEQLFHAVCGETGFANAVRTDSGYAYPWPALDEAETKARAIIARAQGKG